MAGPPQKVEPSALWVALASAKRPNKIVDFPRKDPVTGEPIGQLRMVPLTEAETIQAKAAALAYMRDVLKLKVEAPELQDGYRQIFEDACATEILFRAAKRLDYEDLAAFPSAAEVRAKLTSDEMGVLISSYAIVQQELGPIVSTLSVAEMDAWLDRLGDGGSQLPLASFSLGQLRDLVMHSASRLATSPTGNTSPGEQPSDA